MKQVLTADEVRARWGRLLAAKRNEEGLTQVQLAAELELFPQTISRLERGEMGTMDTYLKVAQHLKVDLLSGES